MPIFNLEFPPWCNEINLFGYCFSRVDDYKSKLMSLQHLITGFSEYQIKANTGEHAQTAIVKIPSTECDAVLEFESKNNTALIDLLLLLSIFTGRDVFTLKLPNDDAKNDNDFGVIVADPRIYKWGGILRCSIPYKKQPIEPDPFGYDIGFEEGINKIYDLIISDDWQYKYQRGYFLFLARMAFRCQPLESSFIQCWTIWEHLFAVLNRNWMSMEQIRRMSSVEKISFILVNFTLTAEISNKSRKRIEDLAEIRNRLIHFGRFPKRGSVHDDAILFMRLTEFVISKILGLSPSGVFNTLEKLEQYLNKFKDQQKSTPNKPLKTDRRNGLS